MDFGVSPTPSGPDVLRERGVSRTPDTWRDILPSRRRGVI